MIATVLELDQHLPRHLWEDLIGLPFKLRGRGPDEYDCFGLLCEIYRRRGIVIPDCFYGEDAEQQARLLASGSEAWQACPRGSGAAILFRSWASTAATHVGVMVNQEAYIHATEDLGQVALGSVYRVHQSLILGWFIPPDSYERIS